MAPMRRDIATRKLEALGKGGLWGAGYDYTARSLERTRQVPILAIADAGPFREPAEFIVYKRK